MILSGRVSLVIVFLITPFIEGEAQFSLNPPKRTTSGSVQYIHNLNEINSPIEYPIEGTPYLDDAFSKGDIYSSNGKFTDVEMRYDIFSDWMEFRRNDSVFIIDPDLAIIRVELGTQTFVVNNYELKGKTTLGYLLRLDSGRVTLMAKPMVIFKDRQQKPIEGEIPAKYQRVPDIYYLKVGNGSLIKVRNVKKIIEALPDRKQEMEAYARKEKKASSDKTEELTKLIHHYNSLQ